MSIHVFALFFNAALSFATFSLLTHYLDEVDYGIINLYNSLTIFIVPFISIGVPYTLNVDYFRMDEMAFRARFSNAVVIPAVMSVLITLIFVVFWVPIQSLIKTNLFFLFTLPLSCLLIVFIEILLYIVRNKGKHYLYAGIVMSRSIIETGVTVLLVVSLGLTWTGRLGGALIALLTTSLVLTYLAYRWKLFTGSYTKTEVKSIFRQGIPFIPERLAIFFLAYSDRFFIDFFEGTGDVGYYGAGAQIAIIVNLAILSLVNAFQPYLFKHLASMEWGKVRKGTFGFIGVSAAVTISVIAATPLLFQFFIGEKFQPGQVYAKYLTLGFFLWSIYVVFAAYLLYVKQNRAIMLISIAGMILSVTLNYFNVKNLGAIGATYTSMIVYFFMAIATIYAVHTRFNLKKILFQS